MLRAAIRGDRSALAQAVPNAAIRRKIASFGAGVRQKGNISVHVTPSFTMSRLGNGNLGAEFNVVGHTHHGDVRAPQTVYLTVRSGATIVVQDQPMQEW